MTSDVQLNDTWKVQGSSVYSWYVIGFTDQDFVVLHVMLNNNLTLFDRNFQAADTIMVLTENALTRWCSLDHRGLYG